tara:strand:+ start:846 stop:1535 length:690 start_codon:yes stop_codon:yes gene_type:complete
MIQQFKSKVVSNKQLTEDVKLITFTCPDDFTFQPGQFASIILEKDGETKLRPYSILNPPTEKGQLEIVFKLVPEGLCTPILFEANEGDEFDLKGPMGRFLLDEKSENKGHWFIANGTGVAPFYSMLKTFLSKYPMKEFGLIFGVRHVKSLFLHENFIALDKEFDNFTYIPTCSRENWEGSMGRVQEHLPDDLSNKCFYICGLKEMVEDTRKLLDDKGVDKSNVHFERYS